MRTRFSLPIECLKAQNQSKVVSDLQTGDLIKVQADVLPILYHYGIVWRENEEIYVLHNDPFRINSKGGNLVKEPVKKFLNNRDIISVEKTKLRTRDIDELYESLKKYKYHFLNFNCEHFINFAKGNKYASSQVLRWTGVAAIGLLAFYLIRNKKL